MKDRRLPPFVWQSRAAMDRVRHVYVKKERATAVAIYQAMTTLANDERGDSFTASRKEIAELAGVSDRTIDRYADAFERVGILQVERQQGSGGERISSRYTLIEPDPPEASSPSPAKPLQGGSEAASHPIETVQEVQQEEDRRRTEGGASPPEQHLPGMDPPAPPPDPLGEKVRDVWNHYFAVFGDRLNVKSLTPARDRQLHKAINAVAGDVSVCKRAIDGLKSYREQNPDRSQDVSLSVVFETGPHSKSNLTDQIEWWAQQSTSVLPGGHSKIPIDLTGVPSVMRGTIHNRRSYVKEMYERPDDEFVQRRGQEASDWLREQCGHEPIVQDGRVTGWREVAA